MNDACPRYFGRSGRHVLLPPILILCVMLSAWPAPGRAKPNPPETTPPPAQTTNLSQVPLFLTKPQSPIAVIDLPKDQSLFMKAYNDYSDLNGDGTLETTYNDSIDYYGYFNTDLCYDYRDGVFEPATEAGGDNGHYCDDPPGPKGDGGDWSGNFLNWVTMSRMDVLRKILYGGKRVVDGKSSQDGEGEDNSNVKTVLERAYLPTDAHAWAKYYDGPDIAKLTPFNPPVAPPPPAQSDSKLAFPNQFPHQNGGNCSKGNYATLTLSVDNTKDFYIGDQVKIQPNDTGASVYMIGGVCDVGNDSITLRVDKGSTYGTPGTTRYDGWTLTDLSQTGISFCNVTPGTGMSQDADGPPLMRVAQGNYALWSANEVWQCHWSEETSGQQQNFPGGFLSNGNRAAFSGLDASAENPSQAANGLGNSGDSRGEYVVRVQVCVPGLIVNQSCKKYPDGNQKPVGLLQRYGDDGTIHFALFTGSYNKNYSGGVLRANAENFANEVNVDTDGTFTDNANIVDTLNKLRIFGFDYDSKNHYGDGDSCSYQITNPLENGEGHCRSWGNPVSEIYLESLRYLAGQAATGAFVPADSVMDLPIASWEDPLTNDNYCSPLDVLAFNTSVSTYDDDQMGGISDLGAGESAQALTSEVGGYEGINGQSWFVGNTSSMKNDLCTAKTISGLGNVNGLCPEGPSQHGSYLMAGTAWYARTHRIRGDLDVPTNDEKSLKVDTFGVQLASNVPRIKVKVGGQNVTILPAYRLNLNGAHGTGTLVDFKVIEQTASHGRFYINWEDSNQGGDFDQDVWGILSYDVNGSSITVTTDTVSASTSSPQGFGYTISGTTQDGPHFTSGIYGFNYSDPTGANGCSNCQLEDAPASATYQAGDTAAGNLEDPLYYAAKWGGFKDTNENDRPDLTEEWDVDGDGQPDNYFFAVNPLGLETALDKALSGVVKTRSSAATAATNSTRLQSGAYVYQALFSSIDWHGELLAYPLDPDTGELEPSGPAWEAGEQLKNADGRKILTWADGDGAEFKWDKLSKEEKVALAIPSPGLDANSVESRTLNADQESEGKDRLAYISGNRSNEGAEGKYRTRNGGNEGTVLGDIVNSNPVYVGERDFGYAGADEDIVPGANGYDEYVAGKDTAMKMIYVGANDGMLHGFDATTGKEKLAYVPQGAYPKLSALTDKDYNANHQYLVDGSPTVVDAYYGSWGTYLISTLGAGGKGIFALNVTNPGSFGTDDVLWEFSSTHVTTADGGDIALRTPKQDTNGYDAKAFADLGYSVPEPAAVLLHNKKWAAIIANGYDSESGTAALYVIELKTGKLLAELDTGVTGGNGLSTPIPVDVDGDHVFDYVYAGDLKGNLWKFDLTSSSPSDWGVAGNGNKKEPLFKTACSDKNDCDNTRQPITAKPEVGAYPTGGVMVYFGTGKYIYNGDQAVGQSPQTQSFYGIRDRSVVVGNAAADGANFDTVPRSKLLQQKFTTPAAGVASGNGDTVRVASDNPINDDYDGWVIDLPSLGERQVSAPVLSFGRIIFTTLAPNTKPCGAGGDSFLVILDAFTGGRLDFSPFDVNDDEKFDDSDKVASDGTSAYISAMKSSVGIVGRLTLIALSSVFERGYTSGSKSNGNNNLQSWLLNRGPGSGPQSWRQLR